MANEVLAARVIFCDVAARDQCNEPLRGIAGPGSVRGRGGIVLPPGTDDFVQAKDFPVDGLISIFTAGPCDRLRARV